MAAALFELQRLQSCRSVLSLWQYWRIMKKWRVRFTMKGIRLETIVAAPSQLLAIMMAKAQYAGTDAHDFNAIEMH